MAHPAAALANFLQVLAGPLMKTDVGARDDFDGVYAERFNLVVVVNVALRIDRGCTGVARRAAPYLERYGEHGDPQHGGKTERKRASLECLARLRRMHHHWQCMRAGGDSA